MKGNLLEWGNLRQLGEIEAIDVNDQIVCIEWELFRERALSRHLGRKFEYPWAVRHSHLKPDDIILDAGSGVSLFHFFLAKYCKKVVSYNHPGMVDAFKDFIDKARVGWLKTPDGASYSKIDFVGGDLKNMNYSDDYFDKVYCISVVEHAKEEERPFIIKELFRVLKPNGILILTVDVPVTLKDSEDTKHRNLTFSGELKSVSEQCSKYCGEIPRVVSRIPDPTSIPFLYDNRGQTCALICMKLVKK